MKLIGTGNERHNGNATRLFGNPEKVHSLLRSLKINTKASRVWTLSCWKKVKFKYKLGLSPTGKWYGDFEHCSPEVFSQHHRYQGISTSILWAEWRMAEEIGCNYIENINEYQGELDKTIHLSRGAISYYGQGLFTKSGNIFGVLGCDWIRPNAFNEEIINQIKSCSKQVESLLINERQVL